LNQESEFFMQSKRSSSRIGAILCLVGGSLVIYSVFFLPMVFGYGGGSNTPHSEWDVRNDSSLMGVVLVALLLLAVLFVLGTGAASFFRNLSPGMVNWRRIAALVGLIIQGPVGYVGAVLLTFSSPPQVGAGYWLALLGCIGMVVGAFLPV
jgi:hypothetical protein